MPQNVVLKLKRKNKMPRNPKTAQIKCQIKIPYRKNLLPQSSKSNCIEVSLVSRHP